MRTNFEYIEKETNAALGREMKEPTLPAAAREEASKAGQKVIAGLAVNDHAAARNALDCALQERRKAVETFCDDRIQAEAKLKELGITPLAILPKTAWGRICAESGLYRLSPDKDGKVPVNVKSLMKEFDNRCAWLGIFGALIPIAPVCVICFTILSDGYAVASEIAAILLFLAMKRKSLPFESISHAELLQVYFPGGVSPKNSKALATLVLPQPPQDVAETLVRAESLKLMVAAVGEAIAFEETPSQIIGRERERLAELRRAQLAEEKRAERERIALDPIIYHEHGSAVAVIAQFGEFPVEQCVVDEIVNSEQLL